MFSLRHTLITILKFVNDDDDYGNDDDDDGGDDDDELSSLRAERHMRERRREKFTHENRTLPPIHPGPADRRPAWA